MFSFQDVQHEVGHQNSKRWEEIWYDLAAVDGHRAGVPVDAIHWDDRVSAPDGGRDFVIDKGATRQGAIFVPDRASVWSVKSGKNGKSIVTLQAELDEKKHPDLIDAIKSGHMYVYCLCHAASSHDRNALRLEADKRCAAMGVGNDSVKLLFDNHLCEGLKKYPGVLNRYCPNLSRTKGKTLDQWGQPRPHFDTGVPYVDIANRRGWIDGLVTHLGASDNSPVLHIAGLSGIGKTRLVYEACRVARVPDIMYFESYLGCMELVQRIDDDDDLMVRFVVDEVTLDQHVELRNKLHGYGARVRVISIGPAGMRDESRETIRVLPRPETTTGVLAVLKQHAPTTVPPSGLEHIAEQSGHDLRFALLMLDAVQRDPELIASPSNLVRALNDTTTLYSRVLRLFSSHTGHDKAFEDRYPWLTLGAHIGVRPPRHSEIAFIANRASCSLIDLERTVANAVAYGLGDQPAHLFEAVPRGMATRLFTDVLWPMIQFRFKELLEAAPDESFVRSIMQRVEMCPDTVRREVTSRIDEHFRSQLGFPSLSALQDHIASRTLRSWAELSPDAGLPWLRQAIDEAPLEQLRAFEGSGGWGPAGPRRDVVWLLEHLACFAEHFATCEAMLFRLAAAENEDIANNATAIWVEKHRVLLSNTQTPYPERINILLARMTAATPDTMRLLMKAFVGSVTSPYSATAPPPTVGGRLVPPEWRPYGLRIYDLFTNTIVEGLRVISGLPPELQRVAREVITSEITTFYKKDTHAALVDFFAGPLDVEERLKLNSALEGLRLRLQDDADPKVVALAAAVSNWEELVAPKDLSERTRLVVGRPPWSYATNAASSSDAWEKPYCEIVRELRAQPDVLRDLATWLDKSEEGGKWSFGRMLAVEGSSAEFDEIIEDWLAACKCLDVCGGFLAERRVAQGALPLWATNALDRQIDSAPSLVARMTIAVDPTETGWVRVRKCIEADRSAMAEYLGRLFGTEWEAVIGPSGQAWVLDQLWPESGPRDEAAGTTALHLFEMFWHRHKKSSLPPELLPTVRRLVFTPPNLRRNHNAYIWKDLALSLAKAEPISVTAFVAKVALDYRTFQGEGSGEAVGVLHELVGENDETIIDAILQTLAEMPYKMPMEAEAFQKLFASLAASTVANKVDAKGVDAARSIGQFVPDPGVTPDGTALLPALTEWYMRVYGDDEECFHEFCTGRWNGRWQVGWAWERQSEVDRLIKAYADHPIKSLRRWAAGTKRNHEADIERDRIRFEEDKRR